MVLSLAFPKVSFAIDKSEFIVRAQSTVSYATSGIEGQLYGSVFPDITYTGYNENLLNCLASFDFSLMSEYDYYYVSCNQSGSYMNLTVCLFNSQITPLIVTDNTYNSRGSNYAYAYATGSYVYYTNYVLTSGYGSWSVRQGGTFNEVSIYQYDTDYGNGQSFYYILDSNVGVYATSEIISLSGLQGSWATNTIKNWFFNDGGYEQCTNIFENTQGYNAQGDIVDAGGSGVEIESNDNHLYFQSCDLGFCEPKGITDFSNFGGAYVYCRYTVDNWVVNHINDYKIRVSTAAYIGSRQYGGHKDLSLDRDGCITVPLSDFYSVDTNGFFTYITGTKIEQDFYKTFLYSMSNSQVQNFVSKKSSVSAWNELLSGNYGNYLAVMFGSGDLYNGVITSATDFLNITVQKFNPYIIHISVSLVDDQDNHSGSIARKFDLVTGNDDQTSGDGYVNDNPFETPTEDTEDPEYTPTIPEDNSTDPSLVVYSGGTWSGVMSATIGFDPGYRDLKNDLNANPEGNFTNYLAPFKNENVSSFVGDTVSGFPVEIKTILVSGFGILTLLGIYRFIRRG